MVHWQSTIKLQMIQMLHDNHQSWKNFIHSWLLPSPFWRSQNLFSICSNNCSITIDLCPIKSNTVITIQNRRTCTICNKKTIRNVQICSTTNRYPTATAWLSISKGGTIYTAIPDGSCRDPIIYEVGKSNPPTLRVEPIAPQIHLPWETQY